MKTYLSEEEILLSESSNPQLHLPFFHDKFNTFIHYLLIPVKIVKCDMVIIHLIAQMCYAHICLN